MLKNKPRAGRKFAKFIQVLVYSDEPQLVLLERTDKALVIAVAVNDSRYGAPFYGVEISRKQFVAFMRERFDLLFLFKRPRYSSWYIFDLDAEDLNRIELLPLMPTKDLSERFFPGAGIFAREINQEVDGSLYSEQDLEKFSIDGNWDLPDFSQFYGKYTDVYVILNSIDVFLDEHQDIDRRRSLQEAFVKPWQGGGSYNAFYDSLLDAQDVSERLSVNAIQYASPGHVDIKGRAKAFLHTREALKHFGISNVEIAAEYNKLHKFLSEEKLLTLSSHHFDRKAPQALDVAVRAERFAVLLGVVQYSAVLKMAAGDPLVVAKVLLSVFRRLKVLYDFFLEGRVKFPDTERI